jgi:predicted nucleotidyltransferase
MANRLPVDGDRVKLRDGRVGTLDNVVCVEDPKQQYHYTARFTFRGEPPLQKQTAMYREQITFRASHIRYAVEYGDRSTALDNEILRTTVGSGVHGIAIAGTDDHDEMGIFIEPPEMVVGLAGYSYPAKRIVLGGDSADAGMPNYVWRTQPEGDRSGPGDTDLVMHSLRKYLRLAVKGNPTALLPLFAPLPDVLHINGYGHQLRGMRHAFLSQHAARRFLGYMHSQHERMMGRDKQRLVPNRPELIEQYGWDVKYGSHALRLALQGQQIIVEADLTLPMPEHQRQEVLAVKRGEVPREEVDRRITTIEHDLTALLDEGKTPLPVDANVARISDWAEQTHINWWRYGDDTTPPDGDDE